MPYHSISRFARVRDIMTDFRRRLLTVPSMPNYNLLNCVNHVYFLTLFSISYLIGLHTVEYYDGHDVSRAHAATGCKLEPWQ